MMTGIMDQDSIIEWTRGKFSPTTISLKDEDIQTRWKDAIRYCNAHSAFPVAAMYPMTVRQQLSPRFKAVYQVYPSQDAFANVWSTSPIFETLGIVLLDNLTSDLIMIYESFKAYRQYVMQDWRWQFISTRDPNNGGTLIMARQSALVTRLCCVGSRMFAEDEDIVGVNELDWLLAYTFALCQIQEGNSIRKATSIGINNDGDSMVSEGTASKTALEEQLTQRGRWIMTLKRI